jgi:16S rRNA G966 N2-methylase RsmD
MSKEALFNVINNHFSFEGLKILDLFSGTGNISYEFASRGSAPITSVDGDFGCVKFIKQVAAEYDFNIAATKSDVFKRNNAGFDIILPIHLTPGSKDFEKLY